MWYEEVTLLLRHMIDDLSDTPKYSDDRLAQLFLLAAGYVQGEAQFYQHYTISIVGLSITPDPTIPIVADPMPGFSSASNQFNVNEAFLNLSLLKSTCLLASSGLLSLSKENLAVREAGYSFDGRGKLAGRKITVDTWCKAYEDAKWEFAVLHRLEPGRAILGPYRVFLDGTGGYDRRGGCDRGGLFQY